MFHKWKRCTFVMSARLRKLLAVHGWPDEAIAGKEGAEAAWLIVQHAIGEPEFQREMPRLLRACGDAKRVPLWQATYLEDRSDVRGPTATLRHAVDR